MIFTNILGSHRDARISTAIVLPGSNIANHIRLFSQMKTELDALPHVHLVSINSKDCVNFKMALNHIVKHLTEKNNKISAATTATTGDKEDEIRYDKRLRYDLYIVADWCRKLVKSDSQLESLSDMRVVISIDDADSFDVSILSSLLKMLQSYISHIPVKLILSVATSVEVFEEKLPRSMIRLLDGQVINACLNDSLTTILKSTIFSKFGVQNLLLGPKLFNSLIQRQRQSLESIDVYISSLKYAYMSHYYSNPFSCLHLCLDSDLQTTLDKLSDVLTPEHCRALRLLGSFKFQVEKSLDQITPEQLETFLTDDNHLAYVAAMSLQELAYYKSHMLYTLNFLAAFLGAIQDEHADAPNTLPKPLRGITIVDLYPLIVGGDFLTTDVFKELKVAFANSGPPVLAAALYELFNSTTPEKFSELMEKLQSEEYWPIILQFIDFGNEGMTGEDKDTSSPMTFQPIPGSFKTREQITAYAKLQLRVAELIFTEYISNVLVENSIYKYFLNEAFVVDSSNLQENVFVPTQRAAIEMALSNPSHYWGGTSTNNKNDPHLCLLYTLYRESSVFVNIYDWYSSFQSILYRDPDVDPTDDAEWEKKTLALFLQGVAELKFLGIIRDSKRKFECVEKLVWRGL